MKSFDVPAFYRSPLISAIKRKRKEQDKLKKDFTPTRLDLGDLQIYLARHFGFCYGVENAIEIAFRTVEENPGKRIFLLSEMIHNPQVNADLRGHGIEFLQDTYGKQLIPFTELTADDVVMIPAFGTTLQIERQLKEIGIQTEKYDTTCPFVEKVWNRSEAIAKKNYSIVIHGKPKHEETRATFSHAAGSAPAVVVEDLREAEQLARYITGELPASGFYTEFQGQYSEGFNVETDLQRIGVVNQTTMLASDTQEISDYLKQTMSHHFGLPETLISERFADTRDTLCYATNDNQTAVSGMLEVSADLAVVVGGYNSSNTSHLVELCELKLPTYFVSGAEKILDAKEILHYNFHTRKEEHIHGYLGRKVNGLSPSGDTVSTGGTPAPVQILITSGASCPDAIVEKIIRKFAGFYGAGARLEELIRELAG